MESVCRKKASSQTFELKTDDIVVRRCHPISTSFSFFAKRNPNFFACVPGIGIGVIGDDNKTIVHPKVAARVTRILTQEDAVVALTDA
jgi:hypothetical protein